ncbi:hypothetical protein A4H97_26005 [Niastella yeongjuensis]|uniref:DUF4468 domain-containing protein n=1 Tax=Niastella yeongjuensis TaxID=354355 RepID=A0A1V9F127_9BACT|nr:hypothetical protein [Niastella yeongjuensis]OQP52070.1 hypothetical protein A4H97_26005 [Niastella yeongjuensis]SEP37148.1 hypothetical protein SAMN05660816_05547 [Niastella yeongjuensis]
MRRIVTICLSIILVSDAVAQIPRSSTGQFQYYGEILAENTDYTIARAKSFFNQPFLVHWDTVASVKQLANVVISGKGYITIKAKLHDIGTPSIVPVGLHMSIEIVDGHYRYIVNHFEVIDKEHNSHYPLEDKPEIVKSLAYQQLLQKTHKWMSFVIGFMKHHLQEE